MDKIDRFKGEYSWLSNMASCKPFIIKGIEYNSVENWYQASKTHNLGIKQRMAKMNPYEAKNYGSVISKRPDWDSVKLEVMKLGIDYKFNQDNFKNLLINTGSAELIEGNYHGDKFWGVDLRTNKGSNHLGNMIEGKRIAIYEEIEKWDFTITRYPLIKSILDKQDYKHHDKAVILWLQDLFITANPNFALVEGELERLSIEDLEKVSKGFHSLVPISKLLEQMVTLIPKFVEKNVSKNVNIFG